ncbi:ABC transporter ATP-binding protein [Sphaerisporangium viridialbum]|uniref:ABC transporter ATP-binding protein n=1 Tax=Sphaerisporangium viridialbum TaxID=46189 RepID=UPI003C7771B0
MTATTNQRVLLSVRQACRTFGSYRAVHDVTFDLTEGEVLGIAGPNGAGKSTLFNLITGVPFNASSGRIAYAGRHIERLPAHKIARLGLRRTFQADQVFPELTALENVRLAAHYLNGRRNSRSVALHALERVGLLHSAHLRGGDLSVLARKKLMIAGALVGDSKVLMLDEPAGGLDTDDQDDLATLVETLNADGTTFVIIEHVLRLLRRVANRMIVMVAGEVLVVGSPDDVLSDPRVIDAYLGEPNQ